MSTKEITAKAQILIRRPCVEVFNAFIDPGVMSKFWFTRKDQGLCEGDTVIWYVGDRSDAFEIEVRIKSIKEPSLINFEWGYGSHFTNVTFTLMEQSPEMTQISIVERGFSGSREEIVLQALDSTCGFNQVVVAAKALLEHNIKINVVRDHV